MWGEVMWESPFVGAREGKDHAAAERSDVSSLTADVPEYEDGQGFCRVSNVFWVMLGHIFLERFRVLYRRFHLRTFAPRPRRGQGDLANPYLILTCQRWTSCTLNIQAC
jgi:hypothetical protein